MGFSGGASPGVAAAGDEVQYVSYMKADHQSWLNPVPLAGIEDLAQFDRSMNVHDAMKEVYDDSPYGDFEPYDVDDDVQSIQDRIEEYLTLADASDIETDIDAAIAKAITIYDTDINPSENIDTLINAAEARANITAQRAISTMATGLRDIRGVMTTQFSMGIALIESDKNLGLQEEDAKLRAFEHRLRTDGILKIASLYIDKKPLTLEYKRMGTAMWIDFLRLKMLHKQDMVEYEMEMAVKDRLWKLEMFQYRANALASITGAATMPRSQTKRERMAAAFTQSLSTGLQVGTSMGSPQAGIAAAAGTFAIQAYGLDL